MARKEQQFIEVKADAMISGVGLEIIRLTNNKVRYDAQYTKNVAGQFVLYTDTKQAHDDCQRMMDECTFPKSEKQGFCRLLTRNFGNRFDGFWLKNEGDYTLTVQTLNDGDELDVHGKLKVPAVKNNNDDGDGDGDAPTEKNPDVKIAELNRELETVRDSERNAVQNLRSEERVVEAQAIEIEQLKAKIERLEKDVQTTDAEFRKLAGWVHSKMSRKELKARVPERYAM